MQTLYAVVALIYTCSMFVHLNKIGVHGFSGVIIINGNEPLKVVAI